MKKVKVLLCMLSLMSLAVLTACDDDDDNGSGGNNPGPDPTNNTALSGRTMTVNVTSSTDPFPPAGSSYTMTFDNAGNYSYTDDAGTFTGTYTFNREGNTGTLVTDDNLTSIMTFTDDNTGTIRTDSTDDAGNATHEEGSFTLTGP